MLLLLLACAPKSDDPGELRVADSDDAWTDDTAITEETAGETAPEETASEETAPEETANETAEETAPPDEDADGDGFTAADDCDDDDADVFPGAGEGHFDEDRGRDDDCDGETDELPTLEWTTDQWRIWLYLADTQAGGDWRFGMAETGDGEQGWYGEDCLDDPADDWDYGYELCHDFADNDLTLGNVDSIGELVAGETTLFYDALLADVTYVLATGDGALCWVWGDDPDWYVTDRHGGAGPLDCVVE